MQWGEAVRGTSVQWVIRGPDVGRVARACARQAAHLPRQRSNTTIEGVRRAQCELLQELLRVPATFRSIKQSGIKCGTHSGMYGKFQSFRDVITEHHETRIIMPWKRGTGGGTGACRAWPPARTVL